MSPGAPRPAILAIGWSDDGFEERPLDPSEVRAFRERWPLVWVNVDGLGDAAIVRHVGEAFGLDPLELEDVLHADQRPKLEVQPGHVFLVLRTARLGARGDSEQVSLFLARGCLLTFRERESDTFDAIRDRLRLSTGPMRRRGADYVAYAVVDAVIDHYFPVLDELSDAIERLEDDSIVRPDEHLVGRIQELRRHLLLLRRAVWPLRDVLASLSREPLDVIDEQTRRFLRDCHDSSIQVLDLVESYREMTAALMDVYLSSISNRLNEVMKVLTMISTLFIPLTFVAGVYGMNFRHMPEIYHPLGYPLTLAGMVAIAAFLLFYFRRKGWLPSFRARRRKSLKPSGARENLP